METPNAIISGGIFNYKGNYRNKTGITKMDDSLLSYLYEVYDEWHLLERVPMSIYWLEKLSIKRGEENYLENQVYESNGKYYYVIETAFDQFDNSYLYIEKEVKFVDETQLLYFSLTDKILEIEL